MTAARLSFDEQYEPSENVISNLEALCENVLQPLRDPLNYPLHVISGYRCPRVNSTIGGASKSQHLTGHAADINDFTNGNEFLLKRIIELKLPFDQVINEFGFRWVHISYDPAKNRRQVLEARRKTKITIQFIKRDSSCLIETKRLLVFFTNNLLIYDPLNPLIR